MKTKLRESAKDCYTCMSCGLPNPNGDLLCLAHSNELAHGRGAFFKSADIMGAIVCQTCHDLVDGRRGALSKSEKREMHRIAHDRTLRFWWENGYVYVGSKPTVRLVNG